MQNIFHLKDIKILKESVSDDFENIFIGFGLEHDSYLLNQLAETKKGEYRFIDKLENTCLVYGEVVHNMLHLFLIQDQTLLHIRGL